jgi:hypothetical protein
VLSSNPRELFFLGNICFFYPLVLGGQDGTHKSAMVWTGPRQGGTHTSDRGGGLLSSDPHARWLGCMDRILGGWSGPTCHLAIAGYDPRPMSFGYYDPCQLYGTHMSVAYVKVTSSKN